MYRMKSCVTTNVKIPRRVSAVGPIFEKIDQHIGFQESALFELGRQIFLIDVWVRVNRARRQAQIRDKWIFCSKVYLCGNEF